MPLAPGERLGPYEILAPLGAGGMGEVYRARDPRLGREVAIKVLPEALACDPDRIARFEREARSASALSHAHVVTVFDVGRAGEIVYFVTEIVPGGSLKALLDAGPMPLRRALALAAQIAAGLAAAHERGIVHRDLKPENVLITASGDAKIADFGLAKLTEAEGSAGSQLPTSDGVKTAEGIVMGTVDYMSPEQARGAPLDFRSDQFAFGSILYEMLSGRPAFRRGSTAETLSAIIRDEPPPLGPSVAVPPPVAWILDRCLAKDPAGRYASTRDLASEIALLREHLSDITAVSGPAPAASAVPGERGRVSGLRVLGRVGLVAAGAIAGALLTFRRGPPTVPPVIRFSMPPPAGAVFASRFDVISLAISPDGSRIAFLGNRAATARDVAPSEGSAIYLRVLSDREAKLVPGTEGATSLFWSPDGRSIGFFAGGQLKRVDAAGAAAPIPISDVGFNRLVAGTWGAGRILYASTFDGVIYRVSEEGGPPIVVVRPDPARGETRMMWPAFLPDGRRFLYLAVHREGAGTLMLGSFDGAPARAIGPIASRVEIDAAGDVVYAEGGALFARRLDPSAARWAGPARPLAPAVYSFFTSKWAGFSVARNGTFAFLPKGDVTRLTWFDRTGRNLGEIGSPAAGETISIAISPDGRRAAFDRTRPDLRTFDVWTIDLARGLETRLTSDPNTEFDPVWMPDGDHFVYSAVRDYLPQLLRRDVAGTSEAPLLPPGTFQEAMDVTPDGKRLLFAQTDRESGMGLWILPLDGAGAPASVRGRTSAAGVAKSQQEIGRLSPDGRFLAYLSEENDPAGNAAYLQPLDSPARRIRISSDVATLLRWSRDGREILYTTRDGRLVSVPVRTTPDLQAGDPATLFRLPEKGWRAFDVAPDGRFLAAVTTVSYATEPIDVVVSGTGRLPE